MDGVRGRGASGFEAAALTSHSRVKPWDLHGTYIHTAYGIALSTISITSSYSYALYILHITSSACFIPCLFNFFWSGYRIDCPTSSTSCEHMVYRRKLAEHLFGGRAISSLFPCTVRTRVRSYWIDIFWAEIVSLSLSSRKDRRKH